MSQTVMMWFYRFFSWEKMISCSAKSDNLNSHTDSGLWPIISIYICSITTEQTFAVNKAVLYYFFQVKIWMRIMTPRFRRWRKGFFLISQWDATEDAPLFIFKIYLFFSPCVSDRAVPLFLEWQLYLWLHGHAFNVKGQTVWDHGCCPPCHK